MATPDKKHTRPADDQHLEQKKKHDQPVKDQTKKDNDANEISEQIKGSDADYDQQTGKSNN